MFKNDRMIAMKMEKYQRPLNEDGEVLETIERAKKYQTIERPLKGKVLDDHRKTIGRKSIRDH